MPRKGQAEDGKYIVEVIADDSGKWAGNQLRFDTEKHAEEYARDLAMRWTLVRDWRVREITDERN